MKHILTRIILCASLVFPGLYASAQDEISITTNSPDSSTSRMVQVAYRRVAKEDLLGGVSSVNVPDIMKKNYFTYSLDNMEAFTGGYNGNLWGMESRLVLIDGVPRPSDNVLPSEIESISFLKSASAVALYGSLAAKGVIYITTKRGKVTDRGREISIHANTGFYVPKSYPTYLGSAQYMSLYNEARANDGLTPSFDDATIYNYASGQNPYRYPNVDFFSSDYLKKASNYSDVSAEISGGNDRAQFYTNIGYYYQNDLMNFGEAKNNNINRLNVRGNIDLKVNDWISSSVDAVATYYNGRMANGNYWGASATLRPYRVAPLIPISFIEQNDPNSLLQIQNSNNIIDGKYFLGGTQLDQTNPFADVYASGYNTYTSRQFQFNASIDMDLSRALKGLSFHTQFAVDYITAYIQSYNNSYAVYQPVWNDYSGTDLISSLTQYGEDKKDGKQNIAGSADQQTLAFSGQFNYKPDIGKEHHFTAMLVGAGYQTLQSSPYANASATTEQNLQYYHRIASNVNLGLLASYNYLQKYYVDLSGTAIHSAKLAPGKRNAVSPSLTLGWKLNRENFLADSPVLDDLTLSASGSILNTDMDISGYYLYDANYTHNGTWWGYHDGTVNQTSDSRRGANDNLTFIKRKEVSVSLKGSLWKNLITADLSVFKNRISGLLVQPATIYPSYFSNYYPSSSFIPYVNFNAEDRTGFDFNVNLNKKIGAVDWTLGVSGIYFNSTISKMDELYADAYQYHKGHPVDGIWGLKSAGFFKNANDVANSPQQTYGQVHPGDIKYIDQNHDGVIDNKDQVYLGKAGWYGAPWTLGVRLEAKWNHFTFFALGTGNYGAIAMKSGSYWWVQGDGKYSEVVLNRWTEATANTATYPRLTSLTSDNNFRSSDFWTYSTDQFNISRVQITYDLPGRIFGNSFIHGLSIYAGGSNLLMLTKERKILEMNVGSAPQTRYYNIGFKALF